MGSAPSRREQEPPFLPICKEVTAMDLFMASDDFRAALFEMNRHSIPGLMEFLRVCEGGPETQDYANLMAHFKAGPDGAENTETLRAIAEQLRELQALIDIESRLDRSCISISNWNRGYQ
jgi:hypothetical protein